MPGPDILTSTVVDSPVCSSSRSTNGVRIDPTTAAEAESARVPSGTAAVDLSLDTVGPGAVTAASKIRAYPALVTSGPGHNPAVEGAIDHRPMWVIEYTNVALPSAGKPGGPEVPLTAATDFLDVKTGLVAFTLLCPS